MILWMNKTFKTCNTFRVTSLFVWKISGSIDLFYKNHKNTRYLTIHIFVDRYVFREIKETDPVIVVNFEGGYLGGTERKPEVNLHYLNFILQRKYIQYQVTKVAIYLGAWGHNWQCIRGDSSSDLGAMWCWGRRAC